jgi:hypothetical protein
LAAATPGSVFTCRRQATALICRLPRVRPRSAGRPKARVVLPAPERLN